MIRLQDAAELYERGGQEEKAASIYIATRNFAAAQPLLARISAPKLHLQVGAKGADICNLWTLEAGFWAEFWLVRCLWLIDSSLLSDYPSQDSRRGQLPSSSLQETRSNCN